MGGVCWIGSQYNFVILSGSVFGSHRDSYLLFLKHIPTLIFYKSNGAIYALPTKEKVKKVVFKLNGDSANGLRGFIAHSF